MKLADVTLREGDQMPGRNYSVDQKVDCAQLLDDLGVDYIQPGFPATGEKDRTVINKLAGTLQAEVVALARALTEDIDAALEANTDVVDVFIPVSDRQLTHLLGRSRAEVIESLGEAVEYVTDHGATAHVTLADAFRTDIDKLVDVIETVPDVQYVTLADTVGARTPKTVHRLLSDLQSEVDRAQLGVHFHDDLGCATANALAAADLGIAKADVSIASLGERAGNSSLEEVVVAATTDHGESFGIDTSQLIPVCQEIVEILGEEIDERKPVLGQKIAEHESGIHTAAMLEDPATLEPYDPEQFGGTRRLLFGAATGTSGARKILQRAGVATDDKTVAAYRDLLSERGPLTLEEAIGAAEDVHD